MFDEKLIMIHVFKRYIHDSIPLVEHWPGKGEKNSYVTCLPEKESYDTKWFDYNEVVHIQRHRPTGN